MAETKTAKRTTKKPASGLTPEERAAMRETLRERKNGTADGENDVLAKIAEMTGPDRAMASRIHAMVKEAAPGLSSRTWYGMPAYTKDGKVVCFFKSAAKFNSRYATFGFEEAANLDNGEMWPTSYALTELTAADEKKLATLIKKAAR